MTKANNTDRPTAAAHDGPPRAGRAWWRLPLLLAVVLAAIVVARSSGTHERGPAAYDALPSRPAEPSGKTVSLVIRFGDGRERQFEAVPWQEEMTVDDLLTAVSRLPNGISYTVYGDREMTLLTRIDDTSNDRPGGHNFWTYSVNDERADRSLAVYELRPGDQVLWKFGPRE